MVVARSRLRMSDAELDDFLAHERVMRLATVDRDGWPHVVPLWFLWHERTFWIYNLRESKRTRNLDRGARASVVVDAGETYAELRGVTARVDAALVEEADTTASLRRLFARKYFDADDMPPTRSHDWRVLTPLELRSWDFRKLDESRREGPARRG